MTEYVHFAGWKLSDRWHAHIEKCIKCGSPAGETIIQVRVVPHSKGNYAFERDDIRNRLCPACKVKYLPLTHAMNKELDSLCNKLWRSLGQRGCICCEAGVRVASV